MRFTLDWNCVIEVEEGQAQASSVIELVRAHRESRLDLALLAASASENTRSKRFPGSAGLFNARISRLSWDDLPIVPMPGIWGLSYWDFCFYVDDGDAFERDMNALWQAIAPKVPKDPRQHLALGQTFDDEAIQSDSLWKWRNAWCDVVSAYSHIHAKRDIFVTNNTSDFQSNATALASLGMKQICSPNEAYALVNSF